MRHTAVLLVGVVTGIPHLRTATSSKQQTTIYWNNCQETINHIYCSADRLTESGGSGMCKCQCNDLVGISIYFCRIKVHRNWL